MESSSAGTDPIHPCTEPGTRGFRVQSRHQWGAARIPVVPQQAAEGAGVELGDILTGVAFIAVWLAAQVWLLPRLGVPT